MRMVCTSIRKFFKKVSKLCSCYTRTLYYYIMHNGFTRISKNTITRVIFNLNFVQTKIIVSCKKKYSSAYYVYTKAELLLLFFL